MTKTTASDYIAIIDSGIGGLSILKALKKQLPNENYIYYADRKYFPYGKKSRKFLLERVNFLCNELINNYPIKLIVLACNTATTTCLSSLKKSLKCKVVGLEPFSLSKKIKHSLVISTKRTKSNCYNNANIITLPKLINNIENNYFDNSKIKKEIDKFLSKKIIDKYKNIILGCTHYNLIKEHFEKSCPELNFVEFSNNVVVQCSKYLKQQKLISTKMPSETIILSSNKSNNYMEMLKQIEKENNNIK